VLFRSIVCKRTPLELIAKILNGWAVDCCAWPQQLRQHR